MTAMPRHYAFALRPLPGTFPPGMRFSSKGLKGMPPQVGRELGTPCTRWCIPRWCIPALNGRPPRTGMLLVGKPTCLLAVEPLALCLDGLSCTAADPHRP